MKIQNQTPVKLGQLIRVEFVQKDLDRFLLFVKSYQSNYSWEAQSDPLAKMFLYVMDRLILKLESGILTDGLFSFDFTYPEAATVLRLAKIIQIEIGEENGDQKYFQSVCSEISKSL